eukprot:2245842-Amphidinium_carterae.1
MECVLESSQVWEQSFKTRKPAIGRTTMTSSINMTCSQFMTEMSDATYLCIMWSRMLNVAKTLTSFWVSLCSLSNERV